MTDLETRLRWAAAPRPTAGDDRLVRTVLAACGPLPRPRPAPIPFPGRPWIGAAAAVLAIAVAIPLFRQDPEPPPVASAPVATWSAPTVVLADPLGAEIAALRRDLGLAGRTVGEAVAWERFVPARP
jgi:hypothetical protein